jgi:hypothetical protein
VAAPEVALELRLAMSGEYVLPDRAHTKLVESSVSADGSSATEPVEEIAIGNDLYVFADTLLTAPLRKGPATWVLIDDPETASKLDRWRLVGGTYILSLVTMLPDVMPAQIIGDETIRGEPTTHTRATVDEATFFETDEHLPLTLDLWMGKSDNFPRHLTLSGSDRGVTENMVIDFTDLNASVTIAAPTPFIKRSDELASLRR